MDNGDYVPYHENQWTEKKEALIDSFQTKIGRLQQVKDSLWFLVAVKKFDAKVYRAKSLKFGNQLKQNIIKVDTSGALRDSLLPLVDSLIVSHDRADSTCSEIIYSLEKIVANRDSAIYFQNGIEESLRDLKQEQELKNKYLTEQLEIAFKSQRKKTRQAKLLAGGLVFLSGVTTVILLTQQK